MIYQIHHRTEVNVPSSRFPVLYHVITYDIGNSKEEVLGRITYVHNEDEVYALQVNEDTLRDEIAHCEDLIRYWETPDVVNQHKSVIITRQRNLIRVYSDMIEKSRKF